MNKIVNKRLTELLVILSGLVLLLTSCGNTGDYEKLFESELQQSFTAEQSSDEADGQTKDADMKPAGSFSIICSEDFGNPYPSGNNQKNLPSGNFVVFQDQILFQCDTGTLGLQLFSLDPASMQVNCFCRDAVCTHDRKENPFCISASCLGNLAMIGENLYALSTDHTLCKYENGQLKALAEGEISYFCHGEEGLFAVTQDSSLIRFGESGDLEILHDAYAEYWLSNYEGKMYGNTGDAYCVLDLKDDGGDPTEILRTSMGITDGERIYYLEDRTTALCTASMQGELLVKLTDRPVMPASVNFDADYVYFRYMNDGESDGGKAEHELYRVQKDGSESPELLAQIPERILNVFTVPGCDTVFITCFREAGRNDSGIYAVKKDGSDFCRLDIQLF